MLESCSLLILACSKQKRSDSELLPAIERYNGPTFRLVRRYLREQSLTNLEIYILSAELGLISQKQLISDYDRKMTIQRSRELQPKVSEKLQYIINSKFYQKVCVCVGNRATHNLWVLLEEGRLIQEHLTTLNDYKDWYIQHLDNTTYRPLINKLVDILL